MSSSGEDDDQGFDGTVILRELRRAGGEVQLTRVIARLAQSDQVFARGFLRALIELAPTPKGSGALSVDDSDVDCSSETVFMAAQGRFERIDVIFTTATGQLFVEFKLFSDYGPDQLRRYLEGIDARRGQFLISVTRNVSRYREPDPDEAAWLGSVRLARFARRLRDLPAPGPLRQQWNFLLDVLKEDGDLGSVELDQALVTAYERSDEAYERLTDFLEQIGTGVLQRLRAQLAERASGGSPGSAAFVSANRRSGRGKRLQERDEDHPEVLSDGEGLYLAISFPEDDQERAWIGFYVDDDGKAAFYVAAGWSEESEPPAGWEASWAKATSTLSRQGGERVVTEDGLYCQIDYPLARLVDSDDVPLALAAWAEEGFEQFVRAGLLDADIARVAPVGQ